MIRCIIHLDMDLAQNHQLAIIMVMVSTNTEVTVAITVDAITVDAITAEAITAAKAGASPGARHLPSLLLEVELVEEVEEVVALLASSATQTTLRASAF
jgi:hypothetical protein